MRMVLLQGGDFIWPIQRHLQTLAFTVPDIGGPPNRYFVVKPKNLWTTEFVCWVCDKHHLNSMDILDKVEEDD
jgi:hypothetical protein